ncbi:helix-turn-helix domain-containing protein [Roseibium aggregatum]|uniref:helix-turn-helix domain-containing protein n=1 Tax=Roseibium aggregatum TaxID=187304 RepID=UPI001E602CC1|nr:helix-turn-helix domain-containing protein [Roseibium aggregatum]
MTVPKRTAARNRGTMRKPNYVDQHVAARIRMRRNLLGMSQDELAKRLGVTAQQTQKYEAGETRVSASRLYAIAQQLGVPVAWFFEGLETAGETAKAAGPESSKAARADLEDILNRREARDLIEIYFAIKDTKLRKRVLDMAELLTQIPD